jgi:hypothetical protein
MFVYHTLLFLQYRRPIVSLAILTDGQAGWRPSSYTYDHWGCAIDFRYPVVKLLDWRGREADLAQSVNPFAQIALAQLAALTSHSQTTSLAETYRTVVRQLYRAGYSQTYALTLMMFMDWVLALPDDITTMAEQEIANEEGIAVERLKSRWEERAEERGLARGLEQGLEQGQRHLVLRLLERRCGPLDGPTHDTIARLSGEQVSTLADALLDFTGRADLDRWLADHEQ